LDELFRQTEGSAINVAAQQIRRGFVPTVETGNDLYLVAVSNAQRAQEMIEELVVRRIPTRFGLDPKLDVQVLSPMHKGPAGVVALNEGLQNLLNPLEPENTVALRGFRRGDKVMQIRNNYDREVFNGDVGLISGIDPRESVVTVRFGEGGQDFRDVDYAIDDLDELMLAYAVSIHKAQGSEFACVIFPLLSSHYALLQRNLVYTALTRAKQLCIVVHQPKALSLAVSAQRRDQRFTHMAELLQSSPDDPETIVELSLEPLEE